MSHQRPRNPLAGRLIRDAARQKKLTDTHLATQVGTYEEEIRRIMRGQMPAEEPLRQLSETLGIWQEVQRALSMSPAQQQRALQQLEVRDLRIEGLRFVRDKGWRETAFIKRLIKIVDELIPDMDADWQPPSELLARVYFDYTYEQTWRLLVNKKDDVVGFWHFDPLKPEKYDRARNGELLDKELTPDALRSFVVPATYDVYISFMGILSPYNSTGFLRLFSSFFEVLDALSADGFYIGSVCANALSERTETLCDDIGMGRLGPHKKRGHVFEDSMWAILERFQAERAPILKDFTMLLERYRLRFS